MKTMRITTLIGSVCLFLSACGGGSGNADSDDDKEPTEDTEKEVTTTGAPATTAAAATTTVAVATTAAPAGISSYQDVQPAVVQIVAQGSFRSVEDGETYTGRGSGTGFIIDPSGIAVTNNHVVTGAATLEIFVGGDTTKSYNASVLGVSECNDLAVIQIDTTEDLPTLEWSDEEIRAGLPIYAAGFPLGETEFTLTAGIVGKAENNGDMPWASIDSTIEHDAVIQPGNSGGPLVDENGKVVAVNYAFKGGVTSPRYQSISNVLAQRVIDKLKTGDFESLGINGEAFVSSDGSLSGVWVAGVAPGSPASETGLAAGDIITEMNGLPVGTDGSMADYCDVLRTAGDKPIAVSVIRYDTFEVLSGEINGEVPLTTSFSFAEEVTGSAASASAFSGYTLQTDDTGVLFIETPNEWNQISTEQLTLDDGMVLPLIMASTNLVSLTSDYNSSGLLFTAFLGTEFSADMLLAEFAPTDCVDNGITRYEDVKFVGLYQVWSDCGGTATKVVTVAAAPPTGEYTALILLQAITDADLEALDRAFATFDIIGG